MHWHEVLRSEVELLRPIAEVREGAAAQAKEAGLRALLACADPAYHALHLYRSLGFREVLRTVTFAGRMEAPVDLDGQSAADPDGR